ncbi:MAG: glycerate kinase [bacterium]
MKVLICPDSFKGTFSASRISELIAQGIKRADPQVHIQRIPLADGGEGTLTVLSSWLHMYRKKVSGPLGRKSKVSARFGIMKKEPSTAVIETAEAMGLHLVPEDKRNPLNTTTFGVGELMKAALDKNCTKIVLGIGGSSTTDAGMGMAQALGVKFFDKAQQEIQVAKKEGYSGASLAELYSIDCSGLDSRIKDSQFLVASDVRNPLYGRKGAAYVYAPQKGASASQVTLLDKGLRNFARAVKRSLHMEIAGGQGAGAAGGLGAGLIVFLGAEIISGIDFVMQVLQLEKFVKQSDVIITGEGRIDAQTVAGKTISGVISAAEKFHKPVIVVAGSLGLGYEKIRNNQVSIIEDASRGLRRPLTYFKNHPELIQEAASNAFTRWRDSR